MKVNVNRMLVNVALLVGLAVGGLCVGCGEEYRTQPPTSGATAALGSVEAVGPNGRTFPVTMVESTVSGAQQSWKLDVASAQYQLELTTGTESTEVAVKNANGELLAFASYSDDGVNLVHNGADTAVAWSSPEILLSQEEWDRFDPYALMLIDSEVVAGLQDLTAEQNDGDSEWSVQTGALLNSFKMALNNSTACGPGCGACCTTTVQSCCCATSCVISTDGKGCKCTDGKDFGIAVFYMK